MKIELILRRLLQKKSQIGGKNSKRYRCKTYYQPMKKSYQKKLKKDNHPKFDSFVLG